MQQIGSSVLPQQLPPGKLDRFAILTLVASLIGLSAIEILSLLVLFIFSTPDLLRFTFYGLFFSISFVLLISMASSLTSLYLAKIARHRWQCGWFNVSSLRLYRTGKFVGLCGAVVNGLLILAYLYFLVLLYIR